MDDLLIRDRKCNNVMSQFPLEVCIANHSQAESIVMHYRVTELTGIS